MPSFFIPGNVPSLKNSKEIVQIPIKGAKTCPCCKNRKGRPMLVSSKRHKEYAKATATDWMRYSYEFRNAVKNFPKPIRIAFKFVRGSRHKFDYSNALDTVQDLMVHHGWIDDDNSDEILPVLVPYEYDKENPGVWITV